MEYRAQCMWHLLTNILLSRKVDIHLFSIRSPGDMHLVHSQGWHKYQNGILIKEKKPTTKPVTNNYKFKTQTCNRKIRSINICTVGCHLEKMHGLLGMHPSPPPKDNFRWWSLWHSLSNLMLQFIIQKKVNHVSQNLTYTARPTFCTHSNQDSQHTVSSQIRYTSWSLWRTIPTIMLYRNKLLSLRSRYSIKHFPVSF